MRRNDVAFAVLWLCVYGVMVLWLRRKHKALVFALLLLGLIKVKSFHLFVAVSEFGLATH